jgi:myo-inositol 2-dehydrogenase/D-chiro-inositol 1-dehydrogenase
MTSTTYISAPGKVYRAAVFGYGNMGKRHTAALDADPRFELAWICDLNPDNRAEASERFPRAKITDNPRDVFGDSSLDLAGVFTRADVRPEIIREAVSRGLHVMAEKPLGPDESAENALLVDIEKSDRIVAVNLFNRNAWYQTEAREFVDRGEIGKLAVIRICHVFPGPMPAKGKPMPDGAPFRDCGMHYTDMVRWHGRSDYAEWSARGACLWGEDPTMPYWVTIHGWLQNNVLFEITNSYGYAQGAKDRRNNSYLDLVGTHGVIHMQYDAWGDVLYDAHGINETHHVKKAYKDKNFGVLYQNLSRALDTGDYGNLASARDSVVAANIAEAMNRSAVEAGPRSVGTWADLENVKEIRRQREN